MRHLKTSHIASVFLLLLPAVGQSQTSLVYQGNPSLVKAGSLSDWTILNSSVQETHVCLLEEVSTISGTKVLTQQSGFFDLRIGSMQVPENITGIPQILTSEAQNTYTRYGSLPVDNYSICAKVVQQGTGKVLAQLCREVDLILSPPQLVLPFDNEHIQPMQPVFTWLRPANSSGEAQGINYTITISQIQPGQSASEAINSNMYTLQASNLNTETFLYPPSAKELEPGSKYAWQVTAIANGQPIGKTQVWTFTPDPLAKKQLNPIPANESFTELKTELDGGVIQTTNSIRFKVISNLQVDPSRISIFDASHKNITPGQLAFKATYEGNRYEIDLYPHKQFKDDHIYYLEFQDMRGGVMKMGFRYLRKKKA